MRIRNTAYHPIVSVQTNTRATVPLRKPEYYFQKDSFTRNATGIVLLEMAKGIVLLTIS